MRTEQVKCLKRAACALAALLSASLVMAVEVSPEQAQTAVRNWIRKNPRPMTAQFATGNGEAKTFKKDGKALFHVVQLEGGGFVVTSGDTTISPIVAFSEDGSFSSDPRNPLLALLTEDMPVRAKCFAQGVSTTATRLMASTVTVSPRSKSANERAWEDLLTEEAMPTKSRGARLMSVASVSKIPDVRVEPLLKTEWDQSTWGNYLDTPNVFNYYTPQHMVCGCVATAGAQIMKYWEYPRSAVVAKEFDCSVNNQVRLLKMKGDVYDWESMTEIFTDENWNLPEVNREAIGRLTYDVGVASHMNYTDTKMGSGTQTDMMVAALKNVFGYKMANVKDCKKYKGESLTDEIKAAIYGSLDAGMPVSASIRCQESNMSGGHSVVFDGYGYVGNTLYTHINCGWAEESGKRNNVWYDVMGEGLTVDFRFQLLNLIGFNIHPTKIGDVISGRVLSSDGQVVVGATVSLRKGNTLIDTAITNERGMWFFFVANAGTFEVSASKDARISKPNMIEHQKLSQTATYSAVAGEYRNTNAGFCGNKWGVDLTLESESEVVPDNPVVEQVKAPSFAPAEGSFTSASLSVTMSCGTSGATIYYTKDGSTPTVSSTRYTGAVTISATTTFKAIAVKNGMTSSDVVSKTYTKVVVKPTISVGEALDDTSHSYTVSDNTLIEGQEEISHDGVDALKVSCSKTVETTVSTTIAGPGTLSFWWCDPSATRETAYDGSWSGYVSCFSYAVTRPDGTTVASGTCSGPEWEKCEIPLSSGSYTIVWKLRHGWPAAARTAYLDEVSFAVYPGGVRMISFDANGADGGALSQSCVTAAFADKVTLPDNGTLYKDGYLFSGWAADSAALLPDYRVGETILVGAQDIRLYAVWKSVITVLSEIPQGGGKIERPLSCYGTHFRVRAWSPEWAGPFVVSGDDWSYEISGIWFEFVRGGPFTVAFSAEGNDTAEDRSYDLYIDALDYPYVIVYHVVQKSDVVTDKPKGLVVDGASSVVAASGVAFGSQVVRRNGSVDEVSPTWEVVSGGSYASVSASGQLTAKSVTSPQTVTLCASYEENGVECTAERDVTILPTCDLNAALDNTELTLQTGTGADAWSGQFDVSNDGTDAARASSALGGTPWIRTTVDGPASVSFDCLISADGGNTLYFVDNGKTNACAFSVPMTIPAWQHKTYYLLGEGSHVIEFIYVHEGGPTGNAGADAAWLDNLVVKPLTGGICEISLPKSGWHLVSFSVLPDDPSPAIVFADVADKIDQVVQGSKVWRPGSGGRLTEIEIGVGYWVRTKADNASWVVAGAANPGVEISLSKGWNLVGYPLLESGVTATVLKTALDSGKVTKIVSGMKVWQAGSGGRLTELSPGKGYWFYAPAGCMITFGEQ